MRIKFGIKSNNGIRKKKKAVLENQTDMYY